MRRMPIGIACEQLMPIGIACECRSAFGPATFDDDELGIDPEESEDCQPAVMRPPTFVQPLRQPLGRAAAFI